MDKKLDLEKMKNMNNNKLTIVTDMDGTIFDMPKSVVYKFTNQVDRFIKPNPKKKLKGLIVDKQLKINNKLHRVIPVFNPAKYVPYKDSIEYLDKWRKNGHRTIILTSRPAIQPMIKATIDLLNYHQVPYDYLIMGCKNKFALCKEINADIFIDNNPDQCELNAKEGIKSLCFNQKDFNTGKFENMISVNNWNSIDLFVSLINYKKRGLGLSIIENELREKEINNIHSKISPLNNEIIKGIYVYENSPIQACDNSFKLDKSKLHFDKNLNIEQQSDTELKK